MRAQPLKQSTEYNDNQHRIDHTARDETHEVIRLLLGGDLQDAAVKVLVIELLGALPQRDHSRLDTDGLELRTANQDTISSRTSNDTPRDIPIELIRTPRELLKVDFRAHRHLSRVNLHDPCTRLLVGQGELDLSVESAGTEEGRIKDIYTVCCGDHLRASCLAYTWSGERARRTEGRRTLIRSSLENPSS